MDTLENDLTTAEKIAEYETLLTHINGLNEIISEFTGKMHMHYIPLTNFKFPEAIQMLTDIHEIVSDLNNDTTFATENIYGTIYDLEEKLDELKPED